MKLSDKQFYVVAGALLVLVIVAMAGGGPDDTSRATMEPTGAQAAPSLAANSSDLEAVDQPSSRLPGTADELRKPLLEIAGLDYDGLPLRVREDGFTGGESINGSYANGMLDFYTMPDGGLWKVRLTSGIADRCGKALSTEPEIAEFIRNVTPSVDAEKIAAKLVVAMKQGTVEQVFEGSLRYTASGDCRHMVDVTELNALPPEKRPI